MSWSTTAPPLSLSQLEQSSFGVTAAEPPPSPLSIRTAPVELPSVRAHVVHMQERLVDELAFKDAVIANANTKIEELVELLARAEAVVAAQYIEIAQLRVAVKAAELGPRRTVERRDCMVNTDPVEQPAEAHPRVFESVGVQTNPCRTRAVAAQVPSDFEDVVEFLWLPHKVDCGTNTGATTLRSSATQTNAEGASLETASSSHDDGVLGLSVRCQAIQTVPPSTLDEGSQVTPIVGSRGSQTDGLVLVGTWVQTVEEHVEAGPPLPSLVSAATQTSGVLLEDASVQVKPLVAVEAAQTELGRYPDVVEVATQANTWELLGLRSIGADTSDLVGEPLSVSVQAVPSTGDKAVQAEDERQAAREEARKVQVAELTAALYSLQKEVLAQQGKFIQRVGELEREKIEVVASSRVETSPILQSTHRGHTFSSPSPFVSPMLFSSFGGVAGGGGGGAGSGGGGGGRGGADTGEGEGGARRVLPIGAEFSFLGHIGPSSPYYGASAGHVTTSAANVTPLSGRLTRGGHRDTLGGRPFSAALSAADPLSGAGVVGAVAPSLEGNPHTNSERRSRSSVIVSGSSEFGGAVESGRNSVLRGTMVVDMAEGGVSGSHSRVAAPTREPSRADSPPRPRPSPLASARVDSFTSPRVSRSLTFDDTDSLW